MFESTPYVCILPSQRAERLALRDVAPAVRPHITLLLELHSIKLDFPDGGDPIPVKSLDRHIVDTVSDVAKSGAMMTPFFWDVPAIDNGDRCSGNEHPVTRLFDECRVAGLPAVPVITLARDTTFRNAVAATIAQDGRGAVVRIKPDAFHNVMTKRALPALLRQLRLVPAEVHLVIDVEAISPAAKNARAAEVLDLINAADIRDGQWRSLTVAAGAFPRSLAGLKEGVSRVTRTDYALWWQVFSQLTLTRLQPGFGDYGIQAPKLDPQNISPKFLKMSANLRYTADFDWAIVRGGIISGKEGAKRREREFRRVTQKLVNLKDYRGPLFCTGDHAIMGCALGLGSAGSPEVWRRHGTTHHVSVVSEQLARVAGL